MKSSTKKKTARPTKPVRTAVKARKSASPVAVKAAKAAPAKAAAAKMAPAKTVAAKVDGKPLFRPSMRFPALVNPKTAPKPVPRPPLPAMPAKQLDSFRRLLLDRKGTLSEAYNKNKTYGRLTEDEGTQDLADKASSAYTKEFLYSLSNTDREILQKVDEALQRVDHGGFGQCVECGDEINRKRLEAVPWASHCIVCQEKFEKGLL
ncbi:MAG TPA: TraR/DksA family transcriptional regulator [Patescibacteria group bacterium]|nr:TraR/DksA family transcriptional regulator [Patescibacteria group bacterium]